MDSFVNIPNYVGLYMVNREGVVKSVNRLVKCKNGNYAYHKERILKQDLNKRGYLTVILSKNNIKKKFTVHKLVALCFLNLDPQKQIINHIDGNKQNNYYKNLEWVNNRENAHHYELNLNKQKKVCNFIGITFCKKKKLFRARISVNGKNVNLGRFKNEMDARNRYLQFVKEKKII